MSYCDRCDRRFPHDRALEQHELNSYRHNICHSCKVDFGTFAGLKEHFVQSPDHDYCQRCDTHFDSRLELIDHYDAEHYYCRLCHRFFQNPLGLHEHYRQSELHHYCATCKREFQSLSNLNSHLNSSLHRPKDVGCHFCSQIFVTRSAMILHLESGSCKSKLDRQKVNRLVLELDKNNVITDPSRMITNGGIAQETTYCATSASWNGSRFECYLCHNTYRTLVALNQHLASPRHGDKIYFCPLSTCRMRFTTLSALCQHIESEKCGVSKFREVKRVMDSLVGGVARLTN